MDLDSHFKESTDPQNIAIHEKPPNVSVIVDKNEKDFLFTRSQDDSKDLESIQKYAKRIKSFLGWEPNIEGQEPKPEQGTLEKEPVEENVIENSSNKEAIDDEEVFLNTNLNISNKEEEKSENICDTLINDGNLFIITEGKIVDDTTSESKIKVVEISDDNKTEGNVSDVRKNVEMEINDNYMAQSSPSTMENDTKISDCDNKDMIINYKKDDLVQESKSEANNNNFILYGNSTLSENLTNAEFRCPNSSASLNHSQKTNCSNAKNSEYETKNLDVVTKELDSSCNSELKEEISPDKDGKILTFSPHTSNKASKMNSLIRESENKISEMLVENGNDAVPKNDLSTVKNMRGNEDLQLNLLNSSGNNICDLNNDKKINIDSRDIKREASLELYEKIDNGLKNNKNESNVSEDIKSEDCLDSWVNDISSRKEERCESNDADDLRSEDSLDFDEDLPREYFKGIRRLSRDIAKEVMKSARSSVHELCTNNFEDLDITLLSESLKSDLMKETHELYFNKYEENPNTFSTFNVTEITNPKSTCLKSNDKIDRTKYQAEQKLNIESRDDICGCAWFNPNWIQQYATPRIFLTFFGIVGIINAIYYTYIVSVMSTLEKRYAFKAKVSGTILFADEVAPLILGSLVGYIGGKAHRPRMVALGMLMSAASYFLYGIPYFIYGSETHFSNFAFKNKTSLQACANNLKSTQCDFDVLHPTKTAVGIFFLASFVRGFSSVMYYVLGMSYMDDIIKRKNTSMYFAIALALRLLGPLVGFLMSSGFLKYYENPLYDPGFGPDDPRWIGAWWMGFFLQGILLVIFTIPIALFPRRLPSQKKVEKVDAAASEDGFKEILTGLISALKRLGKNPVFIVLIINTTMKIFGHFGHAIMLPKYMENQFRLSASQASLYSGATTIVCIILSTLLGGFLIWKFTPRIKVLLGGMIASEAILCIGYLILMIPRCQTSEMLHFGMNEEGLILNSVCNRNCDCSTSSFTPFCGPDGKTLYFSPCYAGCTEEVISLTSPKTNKQFANCSCVDQQQFGGTITEGFCPDENCRSQTIFYLVILFFLVTISNLFTVAATMILLRSVHPSDKSVALGTFETFICLFGFIPFPVTFGALVDSACLVWEKSCGETGNCWFYDMDKYGYLLHGASALFCALSVVCLITLYFLSPRVRNLYIEEDEDDVQTKYVDIKLDTVSGSVTKL